MKNNTLIWGCKQHSNVVSLLIENNYSFFKNKKLKDLKVKFLVDPFLKEPAFHSKAKFINKKTSFKSSIKNSNYFITSIGGINGYARYMISKKINKLGLKPLSLILDFKNIANKTNINKGVQIYRNVVINEFSKIGEYSILNSGSIVEHHSVIGRGVHLMPGSIVAGGVNIKDFASIGAGAKILPNLKIGKAAIIGAGAVVTKNVNDYNVVVGAPAKVLKQNLLFYNDKGFFEN